MAYLPTIFALIALVAAGFFTFAAYKHAEEARDAAHDLLSSKGRLVANEASIDSLLAQLQKLRGQFHAFKASVEDSQPEDVETYANDPTATHNLRAPAGFCENYQRAQTEGPGSAAARCECSYCVEMRHRRDLLRAQLKTMPSHAATVRAIESRS